MKVVIISPFLLLLLLTICSVHAQTWKQLDDKTNAFYSAGKIDSAIFYAEKELTQAAKQFGKADSNYCSSLNSLGFLYEQKGDYAKAEPLLIESLSITKETRGVNNRDYAAFLNDLAGLYQKMGDFKKSEPLFVEAVAIRKSASDAYPADYASSLNNLANLYTASAQYPKAEPLFVEAIAIQKRVFGSNSASYATCLDNLAYLYKAMGLYLKAEPMFVEALYVRKKIFGSEHAQYAVSLNNLARLYQALGDYSKAKPLFLEALAVRKKVLGTGHLDYATSLNNLALLYEATGDYEKSKLCYSESLAIRKKILGTGHPYYAASLNNLALLYLDMGNYLEAEPFFLEALAIRKKTLGLTHPDYATSLNNLANLYQMIGIYKKAEMLYSESLNIQKKILGGQSDLYGRTLNNLAFLYSEMGASLKSETFFKETLATIKQTVGTETPFYATAECNLGYLYEYTGDYAKALPLYLEASTIRKNTLGKNHPEYAASLVNLAILYQDVNDSAKAASLFNQALVIIKNSLGIKHPKYAIALNALAYFYHANKDYKRAEPVYIKARDIILNNVNLNFGFLSETEKEKYVATLSTSFDYNQSFFRDYYYTKPSISSEFYDTELTTKGMVLSSASQLGPSIRASRNPETLATFDHWADLKSTLSKLYSVPIESRQLNTDSIENLANEDEKQLTRLSASFRQGKLLTQANWKSVQQTLGDHDVAVEFASFKYHTDKRWTDTTLYTALVLRKGDAYPAMVNLCREDELNKLLNKAGNTRSAFIGSLYRGGKIASTDTSAATRQKLYKLIWKPMEALLHKGDHIYYAPSGLLHQVAFAAIPREDGKLLSDRYQLTQLSSTAMLLQPLPVFTAKTLTVAAFGGIQYDASTTELAGIAVKDSQRFVSRSLTPDSTRSGSFAYLPGTLTEINNIDSLGKHYQVPVTLFTGINATEESYKKLGLGTSPQIIHISTHGFFFADPKKVNHNNAGILADEKQTFRLSDDPLNRSGLAFAGANHAWKGEAIPPGQEDGILTAYEASNVPLSNTRLVVLSACETGLGDIKGSEGVFGLQRAFKAAGATYLMMSLWQVPDTETAEFMGYFYKDLFAGQTIEKAFTSSQTTMKNKYRNDPYKWAAFVLMR